MHCTLPCPVDVVCRFFLDGELADLPDGSVWVPVPLLEHESEGGGHREGLNRTLLELGVSITSLPDMHRGVLFEYHGPDTQHPGEHRVPPLQRLSLQVLSHGGGVLSRQDQVVFCKYKQTLQERYNTQMQSLHNCKLNES